MSRRVPLFPIKFDVVPLRQDFDELKWIEWEFGDIYARFPAALVSGRAFSMPVSGKARASPVFGYFAIHNWWRVFIMLNIPLAGHRSNRRTQLVDAP